MVKKVWLVLVLVLLGLATVLAYVPEVPLQADIHFTNKSTFDQYNIQMEYYFVNQDPDPVAPGENVEVRWKLENLGGEAVENVIVEVLPEYPFSLLSGESAIKKIGSVGSRQMGRTGAVVYYKLKVDENAVEGNNIIKIRYSPDNGLSWAMQTFYLRVQTKEAIISVEDVSLVPSEIAPGGEGFLDIKIKNMKNSYLKDVKVKLDFRIDTATTTGYVITELPFTPIGSTNEKIIESMAGKETKDVVFKLMADADAESKAYRVPLKISFSDELDKNFTQESIIGIVIGQKPDLVVNIDETDIYRSGTAGTITVKFTNKGASDIKFLYVELMDDDIVKAISPSGVYVGNIDSDDYESADFDVYVNKVKGKNVMIPLNLDYKDSANNDYSAVVNLNLDLYSSSEAKRYGLVESSSKVGMFLMLLIVVGGYWFYCKKKYKRFVNPLLFLKKFRRKG